MEILKNGDGRKTRMKNKNSKKTCKCFGCEQFAMGR
jgi:hypothetical protein